MTRANNLTLAVGMLLAGSAAAATATCQAGDMGQTVHMWKRTAYAQNALNQPLRPYFVPRRPGDCAREPYCDAGCSCPPPAAMGFQPVRFERLGQIPNEVGLEASAAGR